MRLGRGLIVTLGSAGGALLLVAAPAAPAFASGQVCAGIVIDEATGARPVPQGASVPSGGSDLDLLSAAGDSFTQNGAGLVCAINDYPANGLQNCLEAAHGLFYYWSYWEGDPATNTWTYASVGPAEHTVSAGQPYVEGWRYQNPGPDSPAATPPSVKPAVAFARACESSPPVTTTTESPRGTGGSGSTTIPSRSGATTSSQHKPPTTASRVSNNTAGQDASAAATTQTTHGGSGTNLSPAAGDTPSSTTSPSSDTSRARASAESAPPSHHGGSKGSGGDSALPILLVAAVLGVLAIGAWFRWRRPAEE